MSGIYVAVVIVALLAQGLGSLKRIAQLRTLRGVPRFLVDLAQYSALWPKNLKQPTIKRFVPRC